MSNATNIDMDTVVDTLERSQLTLIGMDVRPGVIRKLTPWIRLPESCGKKIEH